LSSLLPEGFSTLDGLRTGEAARIVARLEAMTAGAPSDVKKLKGGADYRLRVGQYRALFRRDGKDIVVTRIAHRKDVYRYSGQTTEQEMQIRPKILKQDGKPAFVVLPYAEYKRMQEAIEDLYDSLLLARAREEDRGKPVYTLEQVKARIAARKTKGATRSNGRKARAKAG